MVLITDELDSIHNTDTRCADMPVTMLVIPPAMREGATCSDALTAVVPWTCWKLEVVSQDLCKGETGEGKLLTRNCCTAPCSL